MESKDLTIFHLLTTIDGILSRLVAVRPSWHVRHQGVTQWLYRAENRNSFEFELSRLTTELLAPLFPDPRDPEENSEDTFPLALNGEPLPEESQHLTHYSVDWRMIQILSGVRSVLLVLIDSSFVMCKDKSSVPDPDFVGKMAAHCGISAIRVMRSWTLEDFVPNVKYWKDWPLARFLDNPLPPCPKSWARPDGSPLNPEDSLFSGPLRRYVSRVSRYPAHRPDAQSAYRVVFGLAQSKRGFAQVPQAFVLSSFRKHRAKLSTPPNTVFDPVPLQDFVRALLRGYHCPSIINRLQSMEVSTRASNDFPRMFGGQRADLRRQIYGINPPDQLVNMIETSPGEVIEVRGQPPLSRSEWFQVALDEPSSYLARLDPPEEIRVFAQSAKGHYPTLRSEQRISDDINDYFGFPPQDLSSHEGFLKGLKEKQGRYLSGIETAASVQMVGALYEPTPRAPYGWHHIRPEDVKGFRPEYTQHPRAKVASVLEPLKVRLITAMDARLTHVAHPLQESLWRYLRSIKPFRLIGESITPEAVRQMVELDYKFNPNEQDFVSGDYSAATDGLDIRATKVVMEEILSKLRIDERHLAPTLRAVLYEQVLFYPGWTKLDPVLQENGQLMGSILSFVVLCITNLYTYYRSLLPKTQRGILSRKISFDELPVLVNGDDILFRASNEQYDRWINSISEVGFTTSVGKNFKHFRFFTVNSAPFQYRPDTVMDLPNDPLPRGAPRPWRTQYMLSHFFPAKGERWADIEETPLPSLYVRHDQIDLLGFMNVGLLTGQAKITGRDAARSLPLNGWHFGAVIGACNPQMMHKRFLHYHLDSIVRQTRFGGQHLNIFTHPYLGGLGFTVPEGVNPNYSEPQRALARHLLNAAMETYYGQEHKFDLSATLHLKPKNPLSGRMIGRFDRNVEVALYPSHAPLASNIRPFEDSTPIYPLPLTSDYDLDLEPVLVPACRLTNRQIRKATKGARHQKVPLLPIDEMHIFPFIPVRIDREIYKEGILSVDQTCWFPASSPLTDIPPPPPTIEEIVQDINYPRAHLIDLQETQLVLPGRMHREDWEDAQITLVVPQSNIAPPPIPEDYQMSDERALAIHLQLFGQADRREDTKTIRRHIGDARRRRQEEQEAHNGGYLVVRPMPSWIRDRMNLDDEVFILPPGQ